jgi:multiple sugar transport system ATP-binding protein
MGDKIVVMNNAVVEQFGTPQEIYDKPASLFVADFIGSPSMNMISLDGAVQEGQREVSIKGAPVAVPEQLESVDDSILLGVRPEHIRLSDSAQLRARVTATEYLGTTQIVTLASDAGTLKARVDSSLSVQTGEQLGLQFDADRVSLFSSATGKAVRSTLNREVLHG